MCIKYSANFLHTMTGFLTFLVIFWFTSVTCDQYQVDESLMFVESLELFDRNLNLLNNSLPSKELPITDICRHHVIVIGLMSGMVEYLNSDCTTPDYEHEYFPAVDRLVPGLWQKPVKAAEKIRRFLYDIRDQVKVIQDLKDQLCVYHRAKECNENLSQVISQTAIYSKAASVLFFSEKVAILSSTVFDGDVLKYSGISLLMNGKDDLKPIITTAARIFYLLYGKRCHL